MRDDLAINPSISIVLSAYVILEGQHF